jgi:RNA-binding protein
VGKEGVTPAAVRAVQEAFNTRELLKVKVLQEAPVEVREAADELAAGVPGAVVVQTIGRTAVLYRPDPEKPEIRLPS